MSLAWDNVVKQIQANKGLFPFPSILAILIQEFKPQAVCYKQAICQFFGAYDLIFMRFVVDSFV